VSRVKEDLQCDVVVVGGGLGGIYTAHRLRGAGFSVVGIEGAPDFGGVWYHNAYPGARVDTESVDYCFLFSNEVYEGWSWSERYCAQPEVLAYLHWVADQLDVRPLFHFGNWLTSTQWSSDEHRWNLVTDRGLAVSAKFVVMCTGNLSEPKPIPFSGLEQYRGEWHSANRWPHTEVPLADRRIAVVGTGSSGIQIVPEVAAVAEHVSVFQRTPHYVIPTPNPGPDTDVQAAIAARLAEHREDEFTKPTRPRGLEDLQPLDHYSADARVAMLEAQWKRGGHGIAYLFADISTNWETNEFVSEFVRMKIRQVVKDRALAEQLVPAYPIGTRRLCVDVSGYYECFNQSHVQLVDMRATPIIEITEAGIRTTDTEHEVDLIIFALGFKPFLGSINRAGVRDEGGRSPADVWSRGPRTVFGLMTPGFPNFFHPTNAGSPSVLAPLFVVNEFHGDWITELLVSMRDRGYETVEATDDGADAWGAKSAAVAERMIRRQVDNYMVHVNADDGSRIFQPWGAGMATYVPEVRAMTANAYEGLAFA
jgi:cation diffusion facilitator CzcD-associated flavoprotein CzcO